MTSRIAWIRHRPGKRETLAALGAGLVAGGVVFYVARLLLAREPVAPLPRTPGTRRSGDREAE